MRIAIFTTLAFASLAACSTKTDPCAGITDGCIAATIEGDVGVLDSLRFTFDKVGAVSMSTPTTPRPLHLPVAVAIIAPNSAAGRTAKLSVDALDGTTIVGEGASDVLIPATGARTDIVITLVASAATDGGTDAATRDAAVNTTTLVPTPSSLSFPDTVVGQTSASMQIVVSNPTSTMLSFGQQQPTTTGDADSFASVASGTCGATKPLLLPGGTCTAVFTFKPTKTGALDATFTIPVVGHDSFTVELSGNGTKAWSNESITAGSTFNFNAVHGSSADDIYAVSDTSSQAVYHWNGTTWLKPGSPTAIGLGSVYALDTSHVWVGGLAVASGISFSSDGGTTWTEQALGTNAQSSGSVLGILASDVDHVFAVTGNGSGSSNGFVLSLSGGTWGRASAPFMSGSTGIRAIALLGTTLLVAGDDGAYALETVGSAIGQPMTAASSSPIRGAWGDSVHGVYWVIEDSMSGSTIFELSAAGSMTGAPYASADKLHGIAGAVVAGKTELYAVGELGDSVLHGDGTGVWETEKIPTNQLMNSVYVAPNGDVVAVGVGGQIAHKH